MKWGTPISIHIVLITMPHIFFQQQRNNYSQFILKSPESFSESVSIKMDYKRYRKHMRCGSESKEVENVHNSSYGVKNAQ